MLNIFLIRVNPRKKIEFLFLDMVFDLSLQDQKFGLPRVVDGSIVRHFPDETENYTVLCDSLKGGLAGFRKISAIAAQSGLQVQKASSRSSFRH